MNTAKRALCSAALRFNDSALIITQAGGTVTGFDVGGEPHYEVTLDGQTYGPMIETELYWFAYGVSLRNL